MMREAIPPTAHKAPCIWDFYSSEHARVIPCESLSRFMLLVQSPGTVHIEAGMSVPHGYAEVRLYGSLCDDATFYSSEKEGRLQARFKLYKADIHDEFFGLSDEEKRTLVEVVRKKGKGVSNKLFAEALGIRRVV